MGTSRGLSNNLGRVKIDRRGILTDKSIWDERDSSYHSSVRDQWPTVNQGHFYGVEKRRSRTFNSKLNIFRSKIFRFELLLFTLLLNIFLK
jgi:hypothetical protein